MCVGGAVFDLYFITAPKINAAIASFLIAEFHMKLKIGKFLFRNQIGAGMRAGQNSVTNHPLIFTHRLPSVQIHAIERSEEHTSELQSLMRISYAVFCLKKKIPNSTLTRHIHPHDTN